MPCDMASNLCGVPTIRLLEANFGRLAAMICVAKRVPSNTKMPLAFGPKGLMAEPSGRT